MISALLAVLAGAAACGAPSEPGVASANGSSPKASSKGKQNSAEANERFARCMRQHGQNVPDPDAQGNLDIHPPAGGDISAWNAAMRACQHFLPTDELPRFDPRDLTALRAHAKCMRAHGIEVTDPDPRTGRSKFEGRLAHASRAQILNDPQYKAAYEACKNLLPKDGKETGK